MTVTCTAIARRHGTEHAIRRLGCRCPNPELREHIRARARRWYTTNRHSHGLLDDIAVEAACMGRRVRLTYHERWAAIDRLDAAGMSAQAIAARIGCHPRTITRRRARRRTTLITQLSTKETQP